MPDPAASRGKPARSVQVRLRRALLWLILLRGSPEAVALGVAIGTFVAFTPTIGLQMLIAAFLATLLNANRPAAVVTVWITNPLTVPPVYAVTYWVGNRFWTGPHVSQVYKLLSKTVGDVARFDFWEIAKQFTTFVAMGRDIIIPLTIGGVLVGIVAGGVGYLVTVGTLRRLHQRKEQKRRQRAQRRAQRPADARAPR